MIRESSGVLFVGPAVVGRPSRRSGIGREALPVVRGSLEVLAKVREALPDIQEWS